VNAVVKIEPDHEIECDRAKRTDTAVLVRTGGIWVELQPGSADAELKIAIARLELERGDILVVKGPVPHPNFNWTAVLPSGVRVLCIPPEVELSVLTKAEIDALAVGAA
jgi:hypothetical protein